MRVVKEAGERRSEIIACAMELFVQKGYDNTSVTDIMNAVGIAKGTLYYHFKSKEEILNGIIEEITNTLIERGRKIANDDSLNVHEKMMQTLLALRVSDHNSLKVLDETHKPQNALLHQKILQMMIHKVTPILAHVVTEGNNKGVFHTSFPYESAELFNTYGNVIFDVGFIRFPQEELEQKALAFIRNMEIVLGAEQGSMQYVMKIFEE